MLCTKINFYFIFKLQFLFDKTKKKFNKNINCNENNPCSTKDSNMFFVTGITSYAGVTVKPILHFQVSYFWTKGFQTQVCRTGIGQDQYNKASFSNHRLSSCQDQKYGKVMILTAQVRIYFIIVMNFIGPTNKYFLDLTLLLMYNVITVALIIEVFLIGPPLYISITFHICITPNRKVGFKNVRNTDWLEFNVAMSP